MSDPDLMNLIRHKAENDRAELLRKARSEAQAIIDEAVRESEQMRRETIERVHAEADMLKDRRYNSVRFQMNATRYEIKAAAIDAIWHDVKGAIGAVLRSDDYKGILKALFLECIDTVPDGTIVKAHESDEASVKAMIQASGRPLLFIADNSVLGGVEFHWPDGRIVLRNTLYHRLSKLKAEGNAEIARLLFGEIMLS